MLSCKVFCNCIGWLKTQCKQKSSADANDVIVINKYYKCQMNILKILIHCAIMVNTCAVAICSSPQEASYHRFPKNLSIQKVWINSCRRNGQINPATAKVCSTHFTEDDFERDFMNEILGHKTRNILKKNSVPTLLLRMGELSSFSD